MIEHLKSFNILVRQLLFVDIQILDEDKCICLLCSLPKLWDNLCVSISRSATTLSFHYIVLSLLLEEMR